MTTQDPSPARQQAVRFAPFDEAHLPAALAIYNPYVAHTTATWHIAPIEPDELRKLLRIDYPRMGCWAILDGDRLIGWCSLNRFKPREAYDLTAEVSVYLHPDCTGRGLGRMAIGHLVDTGRANGLRTLIAVISGDNAQSIHVFQSMGFEHAGRLERVGLKFGRTLDVVFLQRMLD